MPSLFNFLLLLTLLGSLILVNARKLTSSNAIFSIDLIHRNKSQEQHPLGSISHHHHIRLSSNLYDTNAVQTELITDGGDYAMKFSVGTPPVEFTAVADTGSDLIWVQSSPCQQCLPQKSPLFNPAHSSTHINVPCHSQICNAEQLGISATRCTTRDQSCAYFSNYGDGTRSTGVLSTETITLSTPGLSFPGIYFGCGYIQQGNLGPNGDGIVGLGGGPLSLITQLGPNINYKFSYCLVRKNSGKNSKLNFGLDVSGPGVVSTPFTQKDAPPTFYYLTLGSISIGGKSITVAQDLFIDSGTTLTYLPSNVYDSLRSVVKGAISMTPVDNMNRLFDPCYAIDGLMGDQDGFNPPDLVFHFSGADVVLKAENTFTMVKGLTCFAMIPSDDNYVFGNVAQVNFHVGYDLRAKQVSFAPTDCSNF